MFELTQRIQSEVQKVIIGKDDVIKKVLMAILAQGHVLLEDVPGVGKTTMAMAFAKTLGLDTRRVQFTSDTMPSDVIGFSVYDKDTGKLRYQAGAVMTNLLLADEINRTSSKTQSALLEAMEERRVTIDGETRPLPEPFFVLATQNPAGSAGTQMLPSSQLDRFLIKLSMGYPDRVSQVEIMRERHHKNPLDSCVPVTDKGVLSELIGKTAEIYVADTIYEYIAELVDATRGSEYIQLGVSPRGCLAVCRAAKAWAFISGRSYVIPDDVAEVLPNVCAHRLVLSSKARLHELTAEMLIDNILNDVKRPDIREFSVK
ncbi:MAG: MoxR family ATPase [Clostridiales bacterium]|nr:MoxR family ATPase [Clostridiales bacterium]